MRHVQRSGLLLITLAVILVAGAPGAASAQNPPTNNGTIKIDGVPFDDIPDNGPHVGCTFQIDFYGYDEGDLDADVTFEVVPPTTRPGADQILVTDTVFIGEDDNSGGGSEAGLDASETYTLNLSGITPDPLQGVHVKLTIQAEGSQGADVKHKIFWVTGCTPSRQLTALSAAKVWVGLKNSDAVGLRLDLKAEVFVNSESNPAVGMGQLNNVSSGSSGFNNAVLNTVPLTLTGGPVALADGDKVLLRVSARRTCFGGGHNSGTPRLWYNGQAIDSGTSRDAGSRFDATIDGSTDDYYLRTGFVLDTTGGQSRTFIDKAVNSSVACPNRPFTSFGTWSITP
jgi:hypothetical protein